MSAVREVIPTIISDDKEAKKIRMEIDKSIAGLDEATRLEKKGVYEAATAVKTKWADRMQALNLEIIKVQEEEAKGKRVDERQAKRDEIQNAQRTLEATMHLEGTKYTADMRLRAEELQARTQQANRAADRANQQDAKKFTQFQTSADQERRVLADISRAESSEAHQKDIAVIKQYSLMPPEQLDKNPQIKQQLIEAQTNKANRQKDWDSQIENAKRNTDLAYNRAMGEGKSDKGGDKKRPDLSTFQK
jgi:hypothetical protein